MTKRFRLRPLEQSDSHWIALLNADRDVMRYIGAEVLSYEQALRQAECMIAMDMRSPRLGFWVVEDLVTAEVHGWTALKYLIGTTEIEIGFRLNRPSWGRGIATEAGNRLLAHGFDDLRIDRIVGVAMTGNVPSVRVLEKIGLRLERLICMDGSEWTNYALSRADWVRRRLAT